MNMRGMALITGLLLLAAISLLALVGAAGMILQRHMASNFKHNSTAFQNADLASSEGQAWLFSRPNFERESNCVADCLLPIAIHPTSEIPLDIEHQSLAWWQLNAVEAGTDPATGLAASPIQVDGSEAPLWIIEELHFQPVELAAPLESVQGVGYYRIFGRGSGGDARSVAVTESIVARPWGEGIVPSEYPQTENDVHFCRQLDEFTQPLPDCGSMAWRQRR